MRLTGSVPKAMQDLPLELLNEPFTNNDNGYRPEIIVPRRKFECVIDRNTISVRVSGKLVYSIENYGSIVPIKWRSNLSIPTIYDTYGLQIALSFIQHLVDGMHKLSHVHAYLYGCLNVLGLKAKQRHQSMNDIAKLIANHLVNLDKHNVVHELSSRASCLSLHSNSRLCMPLELVARLTNSLRISKSVSELVLSNREARSPPLSAVMGWSNDPVAIYHSSKASSPRSEDISEWALLVDSTTVSVCICNTSEDRFDIVKLAREVSRSPISIASQPLASYRAYYRSIGCNVARAMSNLLASLTSRVQTMPLVELGCWLSQLLGDLRSPMQVASVTEDELRVILTSLIERASEENR